MSSEIFTQLALNTEEIQSKYGKCPKILYIQVSEKMTYADKADSDQTASEEAV